MALREPTLARAARLRMTRYPTRPALAAAVAVLLLAGCGSGSSDVGSTTTAALRARVVPATVVQPARCFLTVFLSDDATPTQVRHVKLLLVSNKLVAEVAFVSKDLALRRFKLKNPDLAANVILNLFPRSYEAVLRTRGAMFSIIPEFAHGVAGIANVRPSKACGAQS